MQIDIWTLYTRVVIIFTTGFNVIDDGENAGYSKLLNICVTKPYNNTNLFLNSLQKSGNNLYHQF